MGSVIGPVLIFANDLGKNVKRRWQTKLIILRMLHVGRTQGCCKV